MLCRGANNKDRRRVIKRVKRRYPWAKKFKLGVFFWHKFPILSGWSPQLDKPRMTTPEGADVLLLGRIDPKKPPKLPAGKATVQGWAKVLVLTDPIRQERLREYPWDTDLRNTYTRGHILYIQKTSCEDSARVETK